MKISKLLICDDHAIVRAGLRQILEQEEEFKLVGETDNVEEALKIATHVRPDIVIMDLSMPGLGGLEAIHRLAGILPESRVLVLTVHDDEAYFFQALDAGAAGYVLKGASGNELLAALRLVAHGGVPIPRKLGPRLVKDYLEQAIVGQAAGYENLSSRERDILKAVARGRTNKEIAAQLSLSVRTVERHRSSIMHKIGLQNRAELVAYAVRQGFLSDEER